MNDLHCPVVPKRRKPTMGPVDGILTMNSNEKIVTSKGKTVLDLAMECQELEILHFLVVEKGVSVLQYKNMRVALKTLEAILQSIPRQSRRNDWEDL